MPLDVGHSWRYLAKAGFDTYDTNLEVSKAVPVAGTQGVELTSDLGACRLAWVGDALVADRLVNAQFSPSLPIVYSTDETFDRPWKGFITFVERTMKATATQSQSVDNDLTFEGRKLKSIRSVVKLQAEGHTLELITWFSDGVGIVRQEQRTDGELVMKLELLKEKK